MFIYCITNIINNKKYIGKVEKINKTAQERFLEHVKISKSNKRFCLHNSMKKYGVENFSIEILCVCKSVESLNLMEIFFIEKFKTYRYKYGEYFGYNLTVGGDGNMNDFVSEETRRKQSERSKGRKFTDEHKLKISESVKLYRANADNNSKIIESVRNSMKSEEIRNKMSEKAKEQWAKNRDSMIKSLNRPETKMKHKNSLKNYWSNEGK